VRSRQPGHSPAGAFGASGFPQCSHSDVSGNRRSLPIG
jgi:hypothetical protein